jgi:hypothetical protein
MWRGEVCPLLKMLGGPRTASGEIDMADHSKEQGGAKDQKQGQMPGQQQGGKNPGQHSEKGHGENQPNRANDQQNKGKGSHKK